MFLQFDPKRNDIQQLDGEKVCSYRSYAYETRSGETIYFECDDGQLLVRVPFFLCETLFYKFEDGKFLVTNSLSNFRDLELDPCATAIMSKIGFLPLSRSRFKGVEVLCSFCTYRISNAIDSVDGNFPVSPALLEHRPVDISDVYNRFKTRIESDLQRFQQCDNLLLLSGGIDSRLLLDTLLKCSVEKIKIQTHGMPNTGDVLQAHKIVELASVENRVEFNWINLQSFRSDDLESNYILTHGFLSPERLLYFSSDRLYKSCVLFSGLYGDVVFADDKWKVSPFSNYSSSFVSFFNTGTDRLLTAAYDQLPHYEKLNQILLRCQKLTRFSFDIDETSRISIPFLDNDVIYLACVGERRNFYPRLIKFVMDKRLSKISHQSSCSVFTHPAPVRLITKIYHRVFGTRLSRPYFHGYTVAEDREFEEILRERFCESL